MTAALTPAEVATLRCTEFPWTAEHIYLNSAAVGPLPERSRRVLDAWNRRRQTPFLLPDRELYATLDHARQLVARLLNVEPAEIALTQNTGFGLATAARCLPLEPGDIVLASDREFPAHVYPWMRLKDRGVTLELVPVTADGFPDEDRIVERLGDPRVRCLAVSLVQFGSGFAADLARLSAATREAGAFLVVDAIQGLGHVPVDLRATPVDILSAGAQKWLLSPWGTGFCYVRRALIPRLEPPLAGWYAFEGMEDYSRLTRYEDRWRGDARRFELVTVPFQDVAAMNASLELLLELGVDRIQAHLEALRELVVAWADARGVPLRSPRGARASAIVCLVPRDTAGALRALKAARITASLREGAIRLSPHCFNSPDDIHRLLDVLEHI